MFQFPGARSDLRVRRPNVWLLLSLRALPLHQPTWRAQQIQITSEFKSSIWVVKFKVASFCLVGDVVLIPSIKVSHVLWAFHSLYFVFVNAHVNILQKSCETDNKIMSKKLKKICEIGFGKSPHQCIFAKLINLLKSEGHSS